LRAVVHFLETYGLAVVFLVVMLESSGVPLPGETALVTAGVLASTGHFDIVAVIAVAALAAIIGDNIGYWLGRKGGRRLLMRWGPIARHAAKALPAGERFFAKHGGKTVFFARFIAVLRVFGAWIAGMTKMDWRKFLLWNAAGGICWAVGVGLASYYFGKAAVELIVRWGTIGFVVVIVILVAGFFGYRRLRRAV
jgi:membrane protein DedA with SNARE-associated domain